MHRRAVSKFLLPLLLSLVIPCQAQPVNRIRNIDNHRTVRLTGNRYPLALAQYDRGEAAGSIRLEHMILVLKSDPYQQQSLDALLAAQHDPHSPLYHQWLTPESFAERFGVSSHDLDAVVSWLGSQGFSIDEIPAGGRAIVFSGSAAEVDAAFHTSMHRYQVGSRMRLANANDPSIPEALAPVVGGVVTLHDFGRQPMHALLHGAPSFSAGGGYYYLAPGDFTSIYDAASLYANGVNGAGQTIAIVGRCNIPMSDVQTFRQTFGLPANNPTVIVNGPNPGIVSQDELAEADLDVQWSGAIAPKATIDFVVSESTYTTDGVDLSAQYIVSHNLAPVMSTSFGSCEAAMGSSERAFYNNLWQQAAAQGITALVASGDSGAAGCDGGSESQATGGAAVNGLCSTPYSVCVGGTELNEGSNAGQYWSASNSGTWSSALGYIPEKVWNESGSGGGSGLWAGGGGASAYYSKPAWQTGPGVPADGFRDVPDVSLSAAGHDAYMMFLQGGLVGISGTSAASPAFAGLMALVNQQTGARQGNANTTLYALAAIETPDGPAYFHDVTSGNNSVPGQAGFSATAGYDKASGLGSVDAAVLVNHWNDADDASPNFTLNVAPGALAVTAGAAGAVTAQIAVTGGFNAPVSLSAVGLPVGATAVFTSPTLAAPGSGSSSLTITAAANTPAGVYPVEISATGGSVTQSFSLPLTVSSSAGCTLAASPVSLTLNAGASAATQVSCGSVVGGFNASLKLGITGAPQGVTVSISPASVTPGTATSRVTLITATSAPAGAFTLTLTAAGGGVSLSLPFTLTINPAPTFNLSLAPSSVSIQQGAAGQVAITTAHVGTFNATVALSVSGLPAHVTASFSRASMAAPGDGTSTLTITAGSTAYAGTYNLTVRAVGGGITKVLTLPVTIQAQPGFSLIAPNTLKVPQGAEGAVIVNITALVGGFNAPVALSLSASNGGSLPAGLNASFTPASVAAPGVGASILLFAPNSAAKPATYSLTVKASGGGVTRTAPLSLTVTSPPSFSLKAAAPTLNVIAGGKASTQISSTAANGFSSPVALSSSALPPGVIFTFSPSTISGNRGATTLSVQTTTAAVPGSYTISLTGTGGGLTAAVLVTLQIGQFTVAPQSTALTVNRKASSVVTVKISLSGSYAGSVSLTAAGLPSGVTASFSPSAISFPGSGASSLKLSASSTAATGTRTLNLQATSGGITQTANLNVTIQ